LGSADSKNLVLTVVPDVALDQLLATLSTVIGAQVIYNTSGWLDKNNDPPPADFLEAIKEKSTFGFAKVRRLG
jgi:hypothetical protein